MSVSVGDVYFVPVGARFGFDDDAVVMLYAPLKGATVLLRKEEADELRRAVRNGSFHETSVGLSFSKMRSRHIQRPPSRIEDIYEIDILANFKCNFNCIYCYSRKGRSDVELEFAKAKSLIDFLFSKQHPSEKPYKINFSGGGEPLVSLGLIRKIVAYIEEKAATDRHRYKLQMVTNASLITEKTIEFLKEHHIKLVVSFEILKRFQDAERGSYEQVSRAVDLLLKKNAEFGIRATLTRESAEYMPEMVREVRNRFPALKAVVFDTVLSSELFPTASELKSYYVRFEDRFLEAKRVGEELGIMVHCTAFQLLDFVRTRTCLGKMVLTPTGRLSICARISSPVESNYGAFTYGQMSAETLVEDKGVYQMFMAEDTIDASDECRSCFARWNCGGGCRLFRRSFDADSMRVDCDFKRSVLVQQLLWQLSERFLKTRGVDLNEHIRNLIDGGM